MGAWKLIGHLRKELLHCLRIKSCTKEKFIYSQISILKHFSNFTLSNHQETMENFRIQAKNNQVF